MKTKRYLSLFLLIISAVCSLFAQDTLLFENFDTPPGVKPDGWATEIGPSSIDYQFVNGGGTKEPDTPGSRRPPSSYSDTTNALYFFESINDRYTYLVTPPVDLEFSVKSELRFQHAQVGGNLGPGFSWDELAVYYKIHADSSWVESRKIGEYTDSVNRWTEQTILIPDEAHVDSCYFAFKSITHYGNGVCIDDVAVIETGIQERHVETISFHQDNTGFIPSGSKNNPILRINVSVKGNTGDVILNSLKINSLCDIDTDVTTDGVLLTYNSANLNLYAAIPIDTASFVLGEAIFSDLNLNLPTGNTSFWVSCDLESDAGHGNQIDVSVEKNCISINSDTYPASEASPAGSRTIRKAVFYDGFTTDKGWTLSGDFQRNRPLGKGGVFIGNSDPVYAAGDTMILGNDLTGLGGILGDYEPLQDRYDNLAVSPIIDLYYYNDVKLSFLRWLNIENSDTASIELSTDNGSSWTEIWSNSNTVFTDNTWTSFSLDMPASHRKAQSMIRINLGPTTKFDNFSGWNIENLAVTGNYIEYDVGPATLLSPVTGCGHSTDETVSIRVKNFGPGDTPAQIPVRYSFNGGATWTTDTVKSVIAFGGETDFVFSQGVDLSTPGTYNVILETLLEVDEESVNNTFDTIIYVDPTYSLPYNQSFEHGEDFWRSDGTLSSWEMGMPFNTFITEAATGDIAWVTDLDGNYSDLEDSWLTSPCFNFTGVNYPVFEFNLFHVTELDEDGIMLEYSLNNGQSWSRVGDMGDGDAYDWNWYNSNSIIALSGGHGWTGGSADWTNSRILLDTLVFRNQSSVKFRFHFSSDAINRTEGIGIDDIRVYDAPRDIGVIAIRYPITGCAQDIGDYVMVTVKNYGLDTLLTGDTLILGYDFDGESTVVDTFTLEADLLQNDTLQYTFNKPLIVLSSGTKDIEAFSLLPDDVDFYNETLTNDSTSKSIDVKLTPFVFLPPVIHSVRPDTIVLDAYTGQSEDTYVWQDASTDSVFNVTAIADGIYHVTASNALCDYRDTTYVYRLIADVGVTEVIEPVSDCELGSSVSPTMGITNFGTDTIHVGDSIPVRYSVDGGVLVEETAVASQLVFPGDTLEYTFTASIDMSALKSYDFVSFTDLPFDNNLGNDTLKSSVIVYGITSIDLGPDTVVRALSYTIDAGAAYNSYLWQDSSSNQTLLVDTTGVYKVTVTEGIKCENSDSLLVTIIVPDIAIQRLHNLNDACGLSATENLDLYVLNVGTDTLNTSDTIKISYQVNSGTLKHDALLVDRKVVPGDSILYSSSETVDLSGAGIYQFTINASYRKDVISGNNSFNQSVEMWGYPDVSLGSDRVVHDKADTLDAGSGFTSYLWHDGSTDQQFIIKYDERTLDSKYSVTVTDDKGCAALDEIIITFELWDLSINSITSPISACILSNQEELRVLVVNSGTYTIANEQLKIIASIDKGIPVTGQKNITLPLDPGDSLEFIFGNKFDFSIAGDYELKTYLIFGKDSDPSNDTMAVTISHVGDLPVDIGGTTDSIRTTLPHTLDAGADYIVYLWNGVSGNRTYNANSYGWHTLEVTDLYGCTKKDSVYLLQSTGLEDIRLAGELKVYPIPTNNKLNIEYRSQDSERLYLEIFDSKGGKILIKQYRYTDHIIESIDVKGMMKGVYFLKLRSDRKQIIKRVVIQ
ncbi:T9SS type A sorting domain-containing protein [Bacteroidota bacterium]